MLFTKSTAYTLQALIELSKFDNPVDVNKLSEITNIPKPFLAKLLQNLSKKDIVKSFKGVKGGFKLAKKPSEIKIIDIFSIMEDKDSLVFYCSLHKENCVKLHKENPLCSTMPFFCQLEDEIREIISKYTLNDVIRMRTVR